MNRAPALHLLDELAILVRAATTRHATLDDVYLRLTSGRIGSPND